MKTIITICTATMLFSCAAPRAITQSGRVTPEGDLKLAVTMTGNIPTETIDQAKDSVKDQIKEAQEIKNRPEDEKYSQEDGREQLSSAMKPLYMYSIDPVSTGFSLSARYGVFKHFDAGYAYAGGAHSFSFMYQFSGPVALNSDKEQSERFFASTGLQISYQKYTLPSFLFLDKLQELLGYEFKRYDLLLPLILSHSFGPQEMYGAASYGAAYSYSRMIYGFDKKEVSELFSTELEGSGYTVPEGEADIHSFGIFGNIKLGYRWIYAVLSLAIYYQDYGEYELLTNEKVSFSGITFIPALGLEATF